MEALLNKALFENHEEEEELERQIQAELDNFSYCEGNSEIVEPAKLDESVNNDKIEEMQTWKELIELKRKNEPMFTKFEKNIRNLKEITEKFKNVDKVGENDEKVQGINKKISAIDIIPNEEPEKPNKKEEKAQKIELSVKNNGNIKEPIQKEEEIEEHKGNLFNTIENKEESISCHGEQKEKKPNMISNKKEGIFLRQETKENTSKNKEETIFFPEEHNEKKSNMINIKEEIRQETKENPANMAKNEEERNFFPVQNFLRTSKKNLTSMTSSENSENLILEQSYEWLRMQKEDLLSQKLEDYHIQSLFSIKDYKIPLKTPSKPIFDPLMPFNFSEKLLFVQKSSKIETKKPLIPSESTLLPRNSKVLCQRALQNIVNPRFLTYSMKKSEKKEEKNVINEYPILLTSPQSQSSHDGETFANLFLSKFLKNTMVCGSAFNFERMIKQKEIRKNPTYNVFFEPAFTPLNTTNKEGNGPSIIKQLLAGVPEQRLQKLKSLEIKFENLEDLSGLSVLKNLESLVLSLNNISFIAKEEIKVSKLMLVDLSQNKIKDYSFLSVLINLRVLNLELNNVAEIADLKECKELEILNLNKNQITKLQNLEGNKKLKRVLLYQNAISKIEGLEGLMELEELDLGRNKLRVVENLSHLQGLRKLVLYNNAIEKINGGLKLLLLLELYLNNNRLRELDGLCFLPCLREMNLENNEILGLVENKLLFWPNLRVLRLNGNKIGSFLGIFNVVSGENQNSGLLEVIDYRDNPFFFEITLETIDFFKNAIIELCQNIKEINGELLPQEKVVISGLRSNITPKTKALTNASKISFSSFSTISKEYIFFRQLESRKFKSSYFILTHEFNLSRNGLPYSHFNEIFQNSPMQNNSIYHQKARFEHQFFVHILRLQSSIRRFLSRMKAKKQFYSLHLSAINLIQRFYRGYRVRKMVSMSHWNKAAVKVQKVFRGVLLRRKKDRLFSKIEYKDKDLDELEEVDLGFFEGMKPGLEDFGLKVPEFISQSVHDSLSNNNDKRSIGSLETFNKTERISNTNEESKQAEWKSSKELTSSKKVKLPPIPANTSLDISEISSISSVRQGKNKTLPKIAREEKKAGEIMEAWGLKNEAIRETLAYRLEKERKRKEKNKKQSLTAEERFVKFAKTVRK